MRGDILPALIRTRPGLRRTAAEAGLEGPWHHRRARLHFGWFEGCGDTKVRFTMPHVNEPAVIHQPLATPSRCENARLEERQIGGSECLQCCGAAAVATWVANLRSENPRPAACPAPLRGALRSGA